MRDIGGGIAYDKNLYWTGIIFFTGLFLLGIVWWKALVVGALASVSWYLSYARTMVSAVGTGLLLVGLAVWMNILPPASTWMEHLFH